MDSSGSGDCRLFSFQAENAIGTDTPELLLKLRVSQVLAFVTHLLPVPPGAARDEQLDRTNSNCIAGHQLRDLCRQEIFR